MNFVDPIVLKKDITSMKRYLKKRNLRNYALFVLGINSALRVSDILTLQLSDVMNQDGTIKERIIMKEQKTGKSKGFPFTESVTKALTEYLEKEHDHKDSSLFPSREWFSSESNYISRSIIMDSLTRFIPDILSRVKEYRSINELLVIEKLDARDFTKKFQELAFSNIDKGVDKKEISLKRANKIKKDVPRHIQLMLNYKGHDPISRQTVHVFLKESALVLGIEGNISTHSMRKTWATNIYNKYHKTNAGIIGLLQEALNHESPKTTYRYLGITQKMVDNLYMDNPL